MAVEVTFYRGHLARLQNLHQDCAGLVGWKRGRMLNCEFFLVPVRVGRHGSESGVQSGDIIPNLTGRVFLGGKNELEWKTMRRNRRRTYIVGRGRFGIPLKWYLVYLAVLGLIGILAELWYFLFPIR